MMQLQYRMRETWVSSEPGVPFYVATIIGPFCEYQGWNRMGRDRHEVVRALKQEILERGCEIVTLVHENGGSH